MTLEQLRIFTIVAEMLNMTRAAHQLHLSQPAISAAVAALEDRYATRLFDRVGRHLELTEAGRLFLPEAHAVLTQADSARAVLEDLAGLARGKVRIAASQTVATYWLPPRMAHFAEEIPAIELQLSVGNSAFAVEQLLRGDADIGFVEGDVDEPLLSNKIVGGDRIGLYAAADNPLIQRSLSRDDLMNARWVMREQGSGTRDHAASALAQSGIAIEKLRIAIELPSNGAVLEALDGGQLIGVTSELAAAARVKAGLIAPLKWELPKRNFTMLTHRARRSSRALSAFMEYCGD